VSETVSERIAAIDVGTNTVLLTVAELGTDRQIRPILELSRIARLGEGVDQARALSPAAIQRALGVLEEYAGVCRAEGVSRLRIAGTSALRDAERAEEFLRRAARVLGAEVEVASGQREAELSYRGALFGLRQGERHEPLGAVDPKRFVFDVGGGSTELILGVGDNVVLDAISLDLGSVRLFERHRMQGNFGSALEFERLTDEVRATVREVPARFFVEAEEVIGVAGTVASLFSLAHRQGEARANVAHGGRLTLREVNEVCSRLIGMSLEERQRVPCLGMGRADVIIFGAAIVRSVLEARARWADVDDPSLIVSEYGVRYGLLREMAEVR
jgi:exopolyphosphatase / guanosine-5'-triphosphate,3'-diphosphate pyrophosphatase